MNVPGSGSGSIGVMDAVIKRAASPTEYRFRLFDTGEVLQRVDDIAIYIHQLAMDAHGDLYTASVYPEHAGAKRGVEGPSHRRWSRDAAG